MTVMNRMALLNDRWKLLETEILMIFFLYGVQTYQLLDRIVG